MKTGFLAGVSVLALTFGMAAANAQVVDISNIDPEIAANVLGNAIQNGQLDIDDISTDGSGDNLSQTLGSNILDLADNYDNGIVIGGSLNSANVDASVNVTPEAVNLSDFATGEFTLGVNAGLALNGSVDIDAGAAGGSTPNTAADSGVLSADVDLGVFAGAGAGIFDPDYLNAVVQGGTTNITDQISTTALGAYRTGDVALPTLESASNTSLSGGFDGGTLSSSDDESSFSNVALDDNSAIARSSYSTAFDQDGPSFNATFGDAASRSGFVADTLTTNVAFNDGFINGSVTVGGLKSRIDGISTTAIGAYNSGGITVVTGDSSGSANSDNDSD
ncbi:hypothetical protein [Pararhizobium mangrovi]|uniref:Uncharacterized protein n=1 Tax=Pararhizobium mangrovi TaxID=2590452 RepID=A0A506TYS4_9HYPH|nr:hypothetical protein [Pararhizobium mangrovi]TPW26131.1 hypothetical protein FJU11_16020 [Pararhizobium mangrovi]